ncbi:hypothetical protein I553_2526 [Mycobacterium xenopi 4042]|uniref:Uncharacterized protein n=3 Tax=Mycobacterium xenopi TaxID=1789 RepID=A0AAD1H385_MYCXE|nr:hypothetical protein [Mycobacterium xenopi]EUA20623.1 hypothetical protein I552_6844 [Mycobacterium xenopi 3993]EUA52340.1 hypothetical protein I553_2526 [Mycobacterium xenopi 4042]BBU24343.1 hypothetical protein MYXE_41330 [Mycobacterium xenopi]
MLTACDRYGRTLARSSERVDHVPDELVDAVTSAAAQIRRNIDALVNARDGATTVVPATDHLDDAENLARQLNSESGRLLGALQALRQIDRTVASTAVDLGARDGAALTASN